MISFRCFQISMSPVFSVEWTWVVDLKEYANDVASKVRMKLKICSTCCLFSLDGVAANMEVIEKWGFGVKADDQLLSLKIGFGRRRIEAVPLLECGILLLMKSYLPHLLHPHSQNPLHVLRGQVTMGQGDCFLRWQVSDESKPWRFQNRVTSYKIDQIIYRFLTNKMPPSLFLSLDHLKLRAVRVWLAVQPSD